MRTSEKQHNERLAFLQVYTDFDNWLHSLGFKQSDSSTVSDFLWSNYQEHIDVMYGVEHYANDVIHLSIRFVRDRNKHAIMFVDGYGGVPKCSNVLSIEQAKEIVLERVVSLRDDLLSKLLVIKVD